MSRRVCFFAAAIAAGLALAAPADTQTFSKTTHAGLFDPLVADLNGDGHLDIAGTAAPGTVAGVILNNGSGAFGPLVTYPAGGNTQTIAGGDLNGDGRFDLVLTINQADIGLSLLFGNGNGSFQPPVTLPNTAQGDAATAVVADLDNDGKQDIVVAHGYNCYGSGCVHVSKMSVLMGNGDGTFAPTRVVDAGQGMNKIAVGDFNRDGIKDLAISASGARLYRFQGVGDGTFAQLEPMTLVPTPNTAEGSDIDVADFNRDSIEDLVVALSTDGSRLAILNGIGDGNFQAPLIYVDPNLNVPQEVVVADYNGDSLLDLAYGFAFGDNGLFAIRNGNGNGTFQAQRMYEVPPNLSSIGTVGMVGGNFNADTKPDLALSIGGAQSALWVLLNTTGQAPPPTPGAPTLISPAQDSRPTQVITFDWSDVANATSYRIQVDDANTFATSLAFDRIVTPSTFTAPYFLNIRQYWWRVRAINSAGVAGPYSSVRRFTPSSGPAPTTPVAPTLLSPADNSSPVQPLTLDWSDVTDAANYRVQIDDSSAFSSPMIVDQTVFGSQFNAPNMTATQVWWRVRGVNSAGTAGPFSAVGTFFPQAAPPPAAPVLVTPLDGAAPPQPVAFDWDAVTGAANYRLQVDDTADFSSPVVDNTASPSAFTAPMLAATQHWWRVRAINSAGTAGPYSAVRSVTPQGTTPPPPPPGRQPQQRVAQPGERDGGRDVARHRHPDRRRADRGRHRGAVEQQPGRCQRSRQRHRGDRVEQCQLQRRHQRGRREHQRRDHRDLQWDQPHRHADGHGRAATTTTAAAAGRDGDADGVGERAQRRAGDVEPGGDQRVRPRHAGRVVHDRNLDHAERDQRPRRDLVRGLLERRRQAPDVHLHVQRRGVGQRQRAMRPRRAGDGGRPLSGCGGSRRAAPGRRAA